MRFSRQKYCSRLPFPLAGDLSEPSIKPTSSALAGPFFTTEPPRKPQKGRHPHNEDFLNKCKFPLLLLSHFSCVQLCDPMDRLQPTRLLCPWDSPGKNTGVGCHFLLQRMKVKSESEVTQLCPTLSNPMDCSLPGSSVHGIFSRQE